MSDGKDPPRPFPIYAWGEQPGRSRRTTEEHRTPPEQEAAPPASLASAERVEDLAREAEALRFVLAFIKNDNQDQSGRMQFVDQLGILCNATALDSFHLFPSDLLVQVVQVLIEWTSSKNTLERERAAEMLSRICSALGVRCGYQATTEFPAMGLLVGCLILCVFDHSTTVAHCAAEGLRHLYGFAARCKGHSVEEQEMVAQLLEREQDGEESAGIIATLFKGVLSQEELAKVYLTALHGLRGNTTHNTRAAVYVENALHQDTTMALGRVPEIVSFLHGHLDGITEHHARTHVLHIVQLLQDHRLSEVVYALLSCSPQCDSSAATLWMMLVDRASSADVVLKNLMACWRGQPLQPHLSAEEVAPLRWAAAHAFQELMEQPLLSFRQALGHQWEAVGISWLFWLSHVHHGLQKDPPHRLPAGAEPADDRLVRSAAGALQRLLGRVRPDLLPGVSDIWVLLTCPATFLHGVSLFFRALNIHRPFEEDQQTADHVMAVLDGHDQHQQVTAMTILVELLRTSVSIIPEVILRHVVGQLSSPNAALHSLALDGIFQLVEKPQQVSMLLPLLLEVANSLQEPDHPKAQKLFGRLHHCLAQTKCPSEAADVAGRMLPLFNAESHLARVFAMKTFGTMLEREATRALEDLALSSLAPLLLHLQDQSCEVVMACWSTLQQVAILLGHEKLHWLLASRDTWDVTVVIVKRFRKVSQCSFLQQLVEHLKSPQKNIRAAAVVILGMIGQETRDKRKLDVIYQALRSTWRDEQSIRCLALHVIDGLEALNEDVPPGRSLRERLRWILWACCSATEDV